MKKKNKNKSVKQVFTLSKYNGMHHFDKKEKGSPSFVESLAPLHFMISQLYEEGVELGTKIEVTMTTKGKK